MRFLSNSSQFTKSLTLVAGFATLAGGFILISNHFEKTKQDNFGQAAYDVKALITPNPTTHSQPKRNMKNTSKRTGPLTAAALVATVATGHAAPTLITTAQGRGADAPIRGGNWTRDNFGTMDMMRVRNSANIGDSRKTYIRFDLQSLPAAVKKATDVTLGLKLAPPEGHTPADKVWTFNVSGMKDGLAAETWDEKEVSWNTAPANDATSPLKLTADVQPLGTFTITGNGKAGDQIKFSSPQLTKFVKSDRNGLVTFIITRQEEGNDAQNDAVHIFASKEFSPPAPPVLAVAFKGEKAELPTQEKWAELPSVPKPLPYENDIAAFEAADRKNPPAKGGIVFVGSSSIRLWNTLAQDFPNYHVLNRGFGGSEMIDSVHFAHRIVTPYEPKMIVMYAGTNDIGNGKTGESIFENYKAFVAKVREKLPTTPIAYISITPNPARWDKLENTKKANALIKDYSEKTPNLKFIDVFPLMLDDKGQPRHELYVADKLHMTPAGYALWTKVVTPFLPKP
jgi:lysophospholipase L1-like esterase